MKDTIERWLGTLFGLIFVALSVVVTVETLVRKIFNFSLQGADELGGYALAFGATIAFTLGADGPHAHPGRRVSRPAAGLAADGTELAVGREPGAVRGAACLACLVRDPGLDRLHERVADAVGDAAVVAAERVARRGSSCLRSSRSAMPCMRPCCCCGGKVAGMNHEFGPRTTKQEVDEELEDLKGRSTPDGVPSASARAAARGASV